MKKTLVITMRVDVNEKYNETRDALDRRLVDLVESLGFMAVLIPNAPKNTKSFLSRISPGGVILSGGNDIDPSRYSGNKVLAKSISQERDKTECEVMRYALKNKIPLMGICRGMQMINVFLGGSLIQDVTQWAGNKVNHVAAAHSIRFTENIFMSRLRGKTITVNSYHRQAVIDRRLAKGLVPLAYAGDNTIEALMSSSHRIWGVQWHPERVGGSLLTDKKLMKTFFS